MRAVRWPERLVVGAVWLLIVAGGFASAAEADVVDEAAEPSLEQRSDAALEQAYAGDEFWWKRTRRIDDPKLPWLLAVFRWIGQMISGALDLLSDFLNWLLNWLFRQAGLPEFGEIHRAWLIGWLLIILALAAIVWKWRDVLRGWLSGPPAVAQPAVTLESESLPEMAILFDQATRMLQSGRSAEAVRFAFLALLAGLQSRGLLRYDRSRTNREYHGDLRNVPELARAFMEVARPFERAWYGGRPVDRREAERVLEVSRRAVQPVGGSA